MGRGGSEHLDHSPDAAGEAYKEAGVNVGEDQTSFPGYRSPRKRSDGNDTVQTQELPPLTWRMVAELLYASESTKGHERQ